MNAILNSAAALIWALVFRRLAPDVWGGGGTRPMSRMRDLVAFLMTCLVTAAATGLLRGSGLGLIPPSTVETILFTMIRDLAGLMGVGALGLLTLPHLFGVLPDASHPTWTWPSWLRVVEGLAVIAGGLGLLWTTFAANPLPVAFALVLVAVWAAFRATPLITVVLGLGFGVVAVLATLRGLGPFAQAESPFQAAVFAQGFLLTMTVAGLVISFGNLERAVATDRALAAEQQAAARTRLLSAVVDNLHEGIVVIGESGAISVSNPSSRDLLSLTGNQGLDGSAPSALLTMDGVPVNPSDLPPQLALAGSDVRERPYRLRLPDRPEQIVAVNAVRVDGAAEPGRPVVVMTFRDVTREYDDRDQLVAFSGVVAHDLKNPLTVIQGWAEAIQEELADEQPVDREALVSMLDRVREASDQMRTFIDDLLDFTVARDRPLSISDVDLSAVAEEVAELRRASAPHPRITVQSGLCVSGDRPLIRQLLDNLIGNAVKYVAPGVRPQITVTGRDLGDEVEIAITDNGIGIPPESRERVFESFARAHVSSYSGTGLGLAICSRVVTRHGGRIWVDGEVEHGTRIRLTLPRRISHQGAGDAAQSETPSDRRGQTTVTAPMPRPA